MKKEVVGFGVAKRLRNPYKSQHLTTSSCLQGEKPWWKSQFFISQPVLFGTWDGVFTSVMVNIFGVIIFLRSGWVVAQAGIGLSVLMVFCTGI